MIHIGQFNDPFGYFGNMPEIPKDDHDKMDETEMKTVSCLYSIIGAGIFILSVVIAIYLCYMVSS